jgi:collagenase-like PrtC family protease
MVLARELDLGQIRAIAAQVQDAVLEFFVHGALCVAYSGQCFISHAHTGPQRQPRQLQPGVPAALHRDRRVPAASWRTTSMC